MRSQETSLLVILITTFTGLSFMSLFGIERWSLALAVGTAIALMLLLRVPHPPAGSNLLIIMLGGVKWHFLIIPTLVDALALVMLALIYNNIGRGRHYPAIGKSIKINCRGYP